MRTCHNCACDSVCDHTYNGWETCGNWIQKPKNPMNNADCIRAMDDEQLAKFLCEFRSCAYDGHPCDNCKGDPYCTAGHNEMINWLEKPAEENTHEPL